MKNYIILTLILLIPSLSTTTFAQKVDSARVAQIKIDSLLSKITKIEKQNAVLEGKIKVANELNNLEWLLVWMPLLMFLGLFSYIARRLRIEGFKLSEALSTCEPNKSKDPNDPNKETLEYRNSSSRLIAFMSGLAAVVIAITLMSFYYYDILIGNSVGKDYFDGVWKIIAGLGIGILPYGFNMFSTSPNTKNTGG